jgi:hypothetical protein
MIYVPPALKQREPIGAPFVLGNSYIVSPTWTDEEQEDPS